MLIQGLQICAFPVFHTPVASFGYKVDKITGVAVSADLFLDKLRGHSLDFLMCEHT